MSSPATLSTELGFEFARLTSEDVAIAVVPALGARIVSLVDRRTGREWMWHPPGQLRLWANQPGDSFFDGTFAGADECLPTIKTCTVQGRELPDHGEVWCLPWHIDAAALRRSEILTSVRLSHVPFSIARKITLKDRCVRLAYSLRNDGEASEPWLWALHPLLSILPGDNLIFPNEVTHLRVEQSLNPDLGRGSAWTLPCPSHGGDISRLDLGGSDCFIKGFAGPLGEGRAKVFNPRTGDALVFRWDVSQNPYLGLWLTRGGFNGWDHLAIEPTNAPADSLQDAVQEKSNALLKAKEAFEWWVELIVGECP